MAVPTVVSLCLRKSKCLQSPLSIMGATDIFLDSGLLAALRNHSPARISADRRVVRIISARKADRDELEQYHWSSPQHPMLI